MIVEIEVKILSKPISIFIDQGAFCSYISLKIVDAFISNKTKHNKPWVVYLAIDPKRKRKNGLKPYIL